MIVYDDLEEPEGPVVVSEGRILVTEMGPERQCVSEINLQSGVRTPLARTGRPNGLAVDSDGVIWVAESVARALISIDGSGSTNHVATSYDGSRFAFPNDLCFGPDGHIYMTDSGIPFDDWVIDGALRSDWRTVPINGAVFRIDPKTGHVYKVAAGLRFANGLAFDESASFLYVAESITGNIYRYEWRESSLGDAEFFANVLTPDDKKSEEVIAPDGMAFGVDRTLYVAVYGSGRIAMVDPEGTMIGSIGTEGSRPTNLAFGQGESAIYVTEVENGALERYEVETIGLPLLM